MMTTMTIMLNPKSTSFLSSDKGPPGVPLPKSFDQDPIASTEEPGLGFGAQGILEGAGDLVSRL